MRRVIYAISSAAIISMLVRNVKCRTHSSNSNGRGS